MPGGLSRDMGVGMHKRAFGVRRLYWLFEEVCRLESELWAAGMKKGREVKNLKVPRQVLAIALGADGHGLIKV